MASAASAAASKLFPGVRSLASFLFKKHLLATNVALSVGLSGLGDLIQQRHQNGGRGASVDLRRCAHMSLAFGLTSGLLCHHWYLRLDAALSGSGLKTVACKVLADQLLFSPVCIAACLAASGALEGSSAERIKADVVDKGE